MLKKILMYYIGIDIGSTASKTPIEITCYGMDACLLGK